MRAPALALAALTLALTACGTAERKGAIGDTLEAGAITARLERVRDGAVRVALCNRDGQAVIAYHFTLVLDTGAEVHPSYVPGQFSDGFEPVRNGCERGWIGFALPAGAKAERLVYRYDDTGHGGPSADYGEHARFEWTL
jgi:hypothetical protein